MQQNWQKFSFLVVYTTCILHSLRNININSALEFVMLLCIVNGIIKHIKIISASASIDIACGG